MVDTLVMAVELADVNIPKSEYDNWTPSLKGILAPPFINFGSKKYIKSVLLADDTTKRRGEYMPRVSLYKGVGEGGFRVHMQIEFSAPKVVYNNNFDELQDIDLQKVCVGLSEKLAHMGVIVEPEVLERSRIKAVHYGKNVVFTDGTLPLLFLRYIGKANITTRRHTRESGYIGGGQAFYYYNGGTAFCAYDKRKELQKSKITEKGNMETDNYCQKTLLDDAKIKEPFQVLRLEARYKTRTLRSMAKKLSVFLPNQPALRDVFSTDIARRVLLHELVEIENHIPEVAKNSEALSDFAASLWALNPHSTPMQRVKAIAAKALLRETGCCDLRTVLGMNNNQWYRFMQNINELNVNTNSTNCFEAVKTQIVDFHPVLLEEYIEK